MPSLQIGVILARSPARLASIRGVTPPRTPPFRHTYIGNTFRIQGIQLDQDSASVEVNLRYPGGVRFGVGFACRASSEWVGEPL